MKNGKVIEFPGKITQITEKILEEIPEDMRECYRTNAPIRILLKFDSLDKKSQNTLFDYFLHQAEKNGRLEKRNFVIELLRASGGHGVWEDAEKKVDEYLLKGVEIWQEV